MHLPRVPHFIANLTAHLRKIDIATCAAGVSYYAMLASIPLLAVVLTLSARLLPALSVESDSHNSVNSLGVQQLNQTLGMVLPPFASQLVRNEIARIQNDPPLALLSIGILLALWTASNASMAIIKAMNRVYGVEETRSFWKVRAVALALPLLLALIMLVALVSIVLVPLIVSFFQLSAFATTLVGIAHWVGLFTVVLVSFGMTYRIAPNRAHKEKVISKGSIVASLLFLASSFVFQIYVGNFASYDKIYGSLGGAVVFLVWLFLTSACLLFGCALNKTIEDHQSNIPQGLLPPRINAFRRE